MPKLPKISGRKMVKALSEAGFQPVRQKGSHIILKKKTKDGKIGCVVPCIKSLRLAP